MKKIKFVLYTVCISPHQLPFMRLIADSLPSGEYLYIYTDILENGRKELGWAEEQESWLVYEKNSPEECRRWLEECDVLISGIRDFDLFEKRIRNGKTTIYSSERWFKPVLLKGFSIPGVLKLLHPGYLKTVLRFRRLLRDANNQFCYYPISMNAARDAALICSGTSDIEFERKPGGNVISNWDEIWKNKLHLWGYFVESSKSDRKIQAEERALLRSELIEGKRPLRILWVGRMLALKNVDRIIKAFRLAVAKSGDGEMTLTLVGDGPEKAKLVEMSAGLPVEFKPFVPINEVRQIMREHDLYIFASNSFDGWGAVISEAIEERMMVLASRDSGAGATVLPEECIFDCEDVKGLSERILNYSKLPLIDPEIWSVRSAADHILKIFLLSGEKI